MKKINKKFIFNNFLLLGLTVSIATFLSQTPITHKNNKQIKNATTTNITQSVEDLEQRNKIQDEAAIAFEAMNLTPGQEVEVYDSITNKKYKIYTTKPTDFNMVGTVVDGLKADFATITSDAYINLLLPATATAIEDSAFDSSHAPHAYNNKIARIDFRNSPNLTTFRKWSFSKLFALSEVVFKEGASYNFYDKVFQNCISLRKLTNFDKIITSKISVGLFRNSNLWDVKIPASVTEVNSLAFSNIPYMKNLDFSLTKNGSLNSNDTFLHTYVDNIYIPNGWTISNDIFNLSSGNNQSNNPRKITWENVNLSKTDFGTTAAMKRIGVYKDQNTAFLGTEALQAKPLKFRFNMSKFNETYPDSKNLETSLDNLISKGPQALVEFLSLKTKPYVEPIKYLRGITATNDTAKKKFTITLDTNAFYAANTIALEYSDFDFKNTQVSTTLTDSQLNLNHDYSNVDAFITKLNEEVAIWNRLSLTDKTSFAGCDLLKQLKIEFLNPSTEMQMSVTKTKNDENKSLSLGFKFTDINNGGQVIDTLGILVSFEEKYTTFETSNTSNVIDLTSIANADSSQMQAFVDEAKKQAENWNATKTSDFAGLTIFKKLGLSTTNFDNNSTISITNKINEKNNSLIITLTMNNIKAMTGASNTISNTFEILFAPSQSITTFTTNESNLIKDWTAYDFADIATLKQELETEVNAWSPSNSTISSKILSALGVTVTNPSANSAMTVSFTENNQKSALMVELTLTNAYVNTSTTKSLKLNFTLFFKDGLKTSFTTSLNDSMIDWTANADETQMDIFETKLQEDIVKWNDNHQINMSTLTTLSKFGLVISNSANTTLSAVINKDAQTNTASVEFKLDGARLNPVDTTALTQNFVVKFADKEASTFTTSLENNNWDLTSQNVNVVDQFEAALTQEVVDWNQQTDKNDFSALPILKNLKLNFTNLANNSELSVLNLAFNIKSKMLTFDLSINNMYGNNVSTNVIKHGFSVVFSDLTATKFETSRTSRSVQLFDQTVDKATELQSKLDKEIADWNAEATKDLNFEKYPILKWLGVSVKNPKTNSKLVANYKVNPNNYSMGIKLTLENAYIDTTTTISIPLNFNILFKDIKATTFTTSSNSNLDFTSLITSDMDKVKKELINEVNKWNETPFASKDLTFANYPILKTFKLAITNEVADMKLSTPTFSTSQSGNDLLVSLSLVNAYSNGSNTNTITRNFTLSFAKNPVTIFETLNSNIDLEKYEYTKENVNNYLTELNNEIMEWNKNPTTDLSSYRVLKGLGIKISNLSSQSQLRLKPTKPSDENKNVKFSITLTNTLQDGQLGNKTIDFVAQFATQTPKTMSSKQALLTFGVPGIVLLVLIIAAVALIIILKRTKTIS